MRAQSAIPLFVSVAIAGAGVLLLSPSASAHFSEDATITIDVVGLTAVNDTGELRVKVKANRDLPPGTLTLTELDGLDAAGSSARPFDALRAGKSREYRWDVEVTRALPSARAVLSGSGIANAAGGLELPIGNLSAGPADGGLPTIEVNGQIGQGYRGSAVGVAPPAPATEPADNANAPMEAGEVRTISGRYFYVGLDGSWYPAANVLVRAWDNNTCIPDSYLGDAITDWSGYYSIAFDNAERDSCEVRRADPYVTFIYSTSNIVEITDEEGYIHYTYTDWVGNPSGDVDFGNLAPASALGRDVGRMYQWITEAWDVFSTSTGDSIGMTRVRYPSPDGSGAHYHPGAGYTYAQEIHIGSGYEDSQDILLHEWGHYAMDWGYGFDYRNTPGGTHFICDDNQHRGLSFSEGWASFVALAVTGSPVFDHVSSSMNYETASDCTARGDDSEYRVTATFWDLYDSVVDGSDHADLSLAQIWGVIDDLEQPHMEDYYADAVQRGIPRAAFVGAAWQNTIDYNQPPSVDLGEVPDYLSLEVNVWDLATVSDPDGASAEIGLDAALAWDEDCAGIFASSSSSGDLFFDNIVDADEAYLCVQAYDAYERGPILTQEVGIDNTAPVADFNMSTLVARTNALVEFTDWSFDETSGVVAWEWDFGDDTTSASRSPTHAFAAAGVYLVSLSVTDEVGLTAEAVRKITVLADAGTLTGELVWNGLPLSGWIVSLEGPNGAEHEIELDSAGKFSMLVPVGVYSLDDELSEDFWLSGGHSATVFKDKTTTLKPTVSSTWGLVKLQPSGFVPEDEVLLLELLDEGEPVETCWMELPSQDLSCDEFLLEPVGASTARVQPGSYTLRVSGEGALPVVKPLVVTQNKLTTLTFKVEPRYATVTLRPSGDVQEFDLAFTRAGVLVASCHVDVGDVVDCTDEDAEGVVLSGSHPRFLAEPGSYLVAASASGFKPLTAKLTVAADKPVSLPLKFISTMGTLDLSLKSGVPDSYTMYVTGGSVVAECRVDVEHSEMDCDGAAVASYGKLRLPAGTYRVEADPDDDLAPFAKSGVKLAAGKVTKLSIDFAPRYATITVSPTNREVDLVVVEFMQGATTLATCDVDLERGQADCDNQDLMWEGPAAGTLRISSSGSAKWGFRLTPSGDLEGGAAPVVVKPKAVIGGKVIALKPKFVPNTLALEFVGAGKARMDVEVVDANGVSHSGITDAKGRLTLSWIRVGPTEVYAGDDAFELVTTKAKTSVKLALSG